MCGIVGVVSLRKVSSPDAVKFITDGLLLGTIRGEDSTGIFQLDRKNIPFVIKGAEHGAAFRNDVNVKKYITDTANSVVTLVHHRAATRGKVTSDNAHPFTVATPDKKRLIGVHNGTLFGWEGKKKKDKPVEVDSNWAFQHIAEEGSDAFEDFDGAYAMCWWDERTPNTFQMVRNSQRPMHFVLSKDKAQMFFASEAGMLAWITDRNSINTEDEIYQLEVGKLYTFDLEGKEISFKKTNVPSFRRTTTSAWTGAGGSYSAGRKWNAEKACYEDSGFMEGYDEDELWNNYYHGGGGYSRTSTPYYDDDGVPTGGSTRIDAVGRVLRDHRDRLAGKAGVVDNSKVVTHADARMQEKLIDRVVSATLAKQVQATLEAEGVNIGKDDYIVPESWYSDSTATTVEKATAKSLGVFGELQWMQGVMYDPDSCSVIGEVEDFVSGSGKVKYDAELRSVTSSHADRMWINNKTKSGKCGDWVCIIGATTDNTTKQRVFVVAPLSAEGKKKMHAKAN